MSVTQLKDKSGRLTGKDEVRFWIPGVGARRVVFRSRQADAAAAKIPALIAWRTTGEPLLPDVRRWIEKLPDRPFAALSRHGLIPPEAAASRKLAEDHLDDYLATLRARGRTASHVALTEAYARQAIEATGVVAVRSLDAQRLTEYFASVTGRDGQPLSATSKNARRTAVAGFTRWLVSQGYLDRDPLSQVPRRRSDGESERPPRALTHGEQLRLLEATRSGKLWRPPLRNGLTAGAEDRWILYRVALETGLRAGELRSLTRASFDLDGTPPTVTLTKGTTKGERLSGRTATTVLPLRADTAAELREYLADKHPGARALRVPRQTAEMIRFDLEAAEIPYETEAGVAHFHALRHTFCTDLARAGVHPKLAQDLARHSDINLTMSRYSHTLLAERSTAVEALPSKAATKRRRRKNG